MIPHALIEKVKTWWKTGWKFFGGMTKRAADLDPISGLSPPLGCSHPPHLILLYAMLCGSLLSSSRFLSNSGQILGRTSSKMSEAIACGDPISCSLHAKDPANVKPSLDPSTVLLAVSLLSDDLQPFTFSPESAWLVHTLQFR